MGREPNSERERRQAAYDEVEDYSNVGTSGNGGRQAKTNTGTRVKETPPTTVSKPSAASTSTPLKQAGGLQYPPLWEELPNCSSDVLLATLLVCLGGGVAYWLYGRRKTTTDADISRITKSIKKPICDNLRSRNEKVPTTTQMERATHFLSQELPSSCDCSELPLSQTVPSRRVVQEADFFAEFTDISATKTSDLRQKLTLRGFNLLTHNIKGITTESTISYYVAYSCTRQCVVVSLLGSGHVYNLVDTVLAQLSEPNVNYMLNDATKVSHRQVATSAQILVSEIRNTIIEVFASQGYQVVIVGHSQNAAVASLMAVLLKEECGVRNVKAYCISPPPCMDSESSNLCKSYVTSVVHHSDMIPRVSTKSVRNLASLISGVCSSLESSGPSKTRSILQSIVRDSQGIESPGSSKELSLPGSVIFIYYNSTGVHSAALLQDGSSLSILQTISITKKMITDHTISSYEHSLRQLLARLPPDDPSWHWCGPSPSSRGVSSSPSDTARVL